MTRIAHNIIVVHVIGCAGDSGVLLPRLPDQFEQVVDAGQDIVHEDNRVEDFVLVVSELVQRDHGGVSDLGEVLDTVVELTSGSHRGVDGDSQSDGPGERVEDLQEGFGLIIRSVFVDRDKDIVVAQHSGDSEKGRKEVGNDVERVVQVDGEKVLVLLSLQIPLDALPSSFLSAELELRGVLAPAQQSREERARRVPWFAVTDQGGVSLVHLLDVELLRSTRALFRVMRRERAEEFEDV